MDQGIQAFYLFEHDEVPVNVRTPGDVDMLINALLEQTWDNRTAALYHMDHPVNDHGLPDHEFHVAVEPETQSGALRYAGSWRNEGGAWFSQGDSGRAGTVLHFHAGNDNEFPADSDIPVEMVRAAVKEFLSTAGERSTCVRWQPHWSMLGDNPDLPECPPRTGDGAR